MDFGVTFQTDPPASRVVELTQRAEGLGFGYAWTFDSHILWQEPYVIYSQMLAATERIVVGPFVTNPATRDPTVTGSLFATLNDMFGNRTICGIGRGDSSRRVLGRKPTTLAETEEAMHVIKELAEGRGIETPAGEVKIPWVRDGSLQVWMAAYGPKALALCGRKADGFILQLADPDRAEGPRGRRGGRARSRRDRRLRRGAGLCRRRPRPRARAVPLVRRDGRQPRGRHRQALRRGGRHPPGAD
jgi:alkanesulfonate monooxygenase SsuD/methylene tetrahydromethanopterin reductase-like flavin-dependent oxidoreductase (luciferase family)